MSTKNIKQEYDIGNADVFVGKSKRYIGASKGDTQVKLEVEQAKLEAGFPKRTLATAKAGETGTITGTTPNMSMENLALLIGANVVNIESGSESAVDEEIEFSDKYTTLYLNNQKVSSVVVNSAPSTQQIEEFSGSGTSGDTSGDFTLSYPITAVGDIDSVVVDGISYAVAAVGSAVTANGSLSVEAVTTAGATNGNLQFFEGNGTTADAINVEGVIRATYTPVPTPLTEGTDYNIDASNGGIIPISTESYAVDTPYYVNYSYETVARKRLKIGGSAVEAPAVQLLIRKKTAGGKVRDFTIWKAKVTNGMDYNMAEGDFHELPIEMEMLADTSKPEGEQLMVIDEYEE